MSNDAATPSERELFEAAARNRRGENNFDLIPNGEYASRSLRLAWDIWQAARAEPAGLQVPADVGDALRKLRFVYRVLGNFAYVPASDRADAYAMVRELIESTWNAGRQAAQEGTDPLQEVVSEAELRRGPLRTAIETYRATDSSHYGRMAAVVLAMMDELQPCGKHPHPVPYDPSASHVPPDYRDGWNAALRAVAESMPPGAAPADEDAPSLWFGLLAKATGV